MYRDIGQYIEYLEIKYCNAIKEFQKEGKYAESGKIVVASLPSKK